MQVSSLMMSLEAKVLRPPELMLRMAQKNDRAPGIPGDTGSWSLKSVKVAEAAEAITKWLLITFVNVKVSPEVASVASEFPKRLSARCSQLGFQLAEKPVLPPQNCTIPFSHLSDYALLKNTISNLVKMADSGCQRSNKDRTKLLVCIFASKSPSGYGFLKHICDCDIGIISQCCSLAKCTPSSRSQHDQYSSRSQLDQYLGNIALKINVKMGGVTSLLKHSPFPQGIKSILLLGADVSHAGSGDDPAVAAVVGSMDWPNAVKYVTRICLQKAKQEIIQDFKEMAKYMLEKFTKARKAVPGAAVIAPGAVIMFRDGVSEGQFEEVLQKEVTELRAAIDSVYKDLKEEEKPKVTWVVGQKRHNTRLFPDDPRIDDGNGNVKPGTVVDHTITHPVNFDFFLYSHAGIQKHGTTKPTHYHVLFDQNNFTSEALQDMVYKLCYTYARCTRSVSMVPPAFYAHLAAARGWLIYDARRKTKGPQKTPREGETICLTEFMRDEIKDTMFFC